LATAIREIAQQRLNSKKDELTAKIDKVARGHPHVPILTSFPYLGAVGAATLIGVFRDTNWWAAKKCLRKALGVYPTVAKSGRRVGQSAVGRKVSAEAPGGAMAGDLMCNVWEKAEPNRFRNYYQTKVKKGMKRIRADLPLPEREELYTTSQQNFRA